MQKQNIKKAKMWHLNIYLILEIVQKRNFFNF